MMPPHVLRAAIHAATDLALPCISASDQGGTALSDLHQPPTVSARQAWQWFTFPEADDHARLGAESVQFLKLIISRSKLAGLELHVLGHAGGPPKPDIEYRRREDWALIWIKA